MVRTKASCVAAVCAATFAAFGVNAAFAGEITGPVGPNGGLGHPLYQTIDGQHVLNGKSECAFSGLNNPLDGADAGTGLTQSYGGVVNDLKSQGISPNLLRGVPGTACNPTKASGGGA
jgi:hypothetical protein